MTVSISLFRFLPVRNNKIVFIQSQGGGYSCNLKYVAEEIIRQKLPYYMVWLVNDLLYEIPSPIRKIKYNRIRALFELATAHIIINNTKTLFEVKKKPSQYFIYIPHGQPGIKCAEGDAISLPQWYIDESKKHSELTDIFVSLGKYHTQVLRDTFWVPQEAKILECGFPRNDIYYHDTQIKQIEIRKKLNVPEGYYIVLYAPTFRDNNSIEAYNLDFSKVLHTLENRTNNKWLFFITLHPNFKWFKKPIYPFGSNIWNMSDYIDIHELLLIVDVVITDYSSIALDFSNTRRPVFLYVPDLEDYRKIRGLKKMFNSLPFPICHSNEELKSEIETFSIKEYNKKLNVFYSLYNSIDDGHSSERFVEYLKKIIVK